MGLHDRWPAALLLAALTLSASGCHSENKLGRCVGIAQGDRREAGLLYELSIWNIFWGVAAAPLIFPPILVLHHELYCPTGRRAQQEPPRTNWLGETTVD